MGNNIVFRAATPNMTVECTGSRQAGRCYTITTFRVASVNRLDAGVFEALRKVGLLGYGQGFAVSEAKEERELLTPTEVNSAGFELARGYDKVFNPYSRAPYKESYRTVYVYTVTSECDSGD